MKKFKLEVENAIYFQKEGIDCIEFLRKYGIHDNEFRTDVKDAVIEFNEKEVFSSELLKRIFKEKNNVTLECELGHFNEMCDIEQTYNNKPEGCKTPVQKGMSESKIIFYKKVNEEIEQIKEVMKWVGEWNPKIRTNSSPYRIRSPFLIENIKKIGEGIKIRGNVEGFDLYKLTHDGIDRKITEEEKERILKEFREFLDTLKFDIEKMLKIAKEIEKEEIKELEKEKKKIQEEVRELEKQLEEKKEEIKEELEKEERIYRNIYYPIYSPAQLKGVLRKCGYYCDLH